MNARLAVAGLGLYVVAVWAAVGVTAYTWFSETPVRGTSSEIHGDACTPPCAQAPAAEKGPRLVAASQ